MTPVRSRLLLLALAAGLPLAAGPGGARAGEALRLASTTSTRDSGLFDALLPKFHAATGIEVQVIAVGTGRALQLGEKGDVDAILVHDEAKELAFVAAGFGIEREPVLYNHFLLVGPGDDPAGIAATSDPAEALRRIAASESLFASRGDQSGTHGAELRLWKAAGIDPTPFSGSWYRETGSGMGATLNTASQLPAYALADEGTWLAFGNPGPLRALVEGSEGLRNPYALILVNPERHPHARIAEARTLSAWLRSKEGRDAIAAHRVSGRSLFAPFQ